jgi:TRAP-type C4-dicarboxylate transport system substrate-binding protein
MSTTGKRIGICLAALALSTSGAGCAGGDKAGGGGGTTTLTLATPDAPGRPASDELERFAQEVRRRSGGRLRVRIAWEPNVESQGGHKPGADQEIVRLVRSGVHALGMVPARTWDTQGVRTLAALQTPFLITSDELMARVARDAVSGRMLEGLDDTGVAGLALLPESLRHPIGFAHPLLGPGDYAGKTLRVLPSRTSFEIFRALGANPVDLNGAGFSDAARAGELAGTESSFALTSTLPGGTITANVTLFPKFNTLVIARKAFDALPDSQQRVLRDAARATVEYVIDTNPTESEAAAEACRDGYGSVVASQADAAALAARLEPVVARLERDPVTGPLVARIHALKRSATVATGALSSCERRRSAPVANAAAGAATPIDGVYRWMLTEAEMVRDGADREGAFRNAGLQTMTLRRGRFTSVVSGGPSGGDTCSGTYAVEGDIAEFEVDSPECFGHWKQRWTPIKDGLRISDVVSLPPYDRPADKALDRVMWASKPWTRIAGSAPNRRTFPEGVYRANVSEADLAKRGVSREDAFNEHGVITLELRDGRFTTSTQSESHPTPCSGDLVVEDGRATLTADHIDGCGSAAGRVFFHAGWRIDGDTVRFADLVGDDPVIEALYGGRDWRKVE